jgi:hypothetical protein
MIQYLFHAKYLGSKEIPDDVFLKKIIDELNKYKQVINQIYEENVNTKINVNINTDISISKQSELELSDNIIESNGKKYIIYNSKVYLIKKDGTKGRLYGTFTNNQIVKTQIKSKEIVV